MGYSLSQFDKSILLFPKEQSFFQNRVVKKLFKLNLLTLGLLNLHMSLKHVKNHMYFFKKTHENYMLR
jgi:hypothetical protein